MSHHDATPHPEAPAAWRLLGARPPRCPFGTHRRTAWLDEAARRLSHSELAVAHLLVEEGHRVAALADGPGRGRVADLDVCGQPVEVKSWLPPDARGGRRPGARSVLNKLQSARGQATTVLLWARGSGLSGLDAARGVDGFAALGRTGGITVVRVVGDGFDLAWGLRAPERHPARRPAPGVALQGP